MDLKENQKKESIGKKEKKKEGFYFLFLFYS
jgi:hypothetical protein